MLLTYCIENGNIYRILNGYDDCGYVCGRNNTFYPNDLNCSQNDKEATPFLVVNLIILDPNSEADSIGVNRYCVDNCSKTSG